MITNLAQLKRAMAIGTKWRMIYHLNFLDRNPDGTIIYGDQDRGIRTVYKKQDKQVAFQIPNSDELSWIDFGPASDWKFENNRATCWVTESNRPDAKLIPCLTYIQEE